MDVFVSSRAGEYTNVGKIRDYRYAGDILTVGNCHVSSSPSELKNGLMYAGEPWRGPIADFRVYPFKLSVTGDTYWPQDLKLKPPVDQASIEAYNGALTDTINRTDYIGLKLGTAGAVTALVALLSCTVESIKELACEAIANLACVPENRAKIIRAGALPLLQARDMRHVVDQSVGHQASRALVGLL